MTASCVFEPRCLGDSRSQTAPFNVSIIRPSYLSHSASGVTHKLHLWMSVSSYLSHSASRVTQMGTNESMRSNLAHIRKTVSVWCVVSGFQIKCAGHSASMLKWMTATGLANDTSWAYYPEFPFQLIMCMSSHTYAYAKMSVRRLFSKAKTPHRSTDTLWQSPDCYSIVTQLVAEAWLWS